MCIKGTTEALNTHLRTLFPVSFNKPSVHYHPPEEPAENQA